MLSKEFIQSIQQELNSLEQRGKFKHERIITSAQGPSVKVGDREVLMFASNNYLGLGNHPEVVKAAHEGLDSRGYGLSSVRFICGTQDMHRELEMRIAKFFGTEDAILYSTCFMANLGFFASFINDPRGSEEYKDIIYSDELNHASIIDAFKLCKKSVHEKRIYPHADLKALEDMLREDADKGFRNRFIVSDGVFSMEGELAPLPELVALAEKYDAILFVDEAHGTGVLGENGRGTPEALGVHGQIDVISGTLGKALGGAVGGFITGKKK